MAITCKNWQNRAFADITAGDVGELPFEGARPPKISKTTPCKVAGDRRHPNKHLDMSGKSVAIFHYPETVQTPVAPQ